LNIPTKIRNSIAIQILHQKNFYANYVDINLKDYISIINAPTEDKPFNKTFTVQYLGNVEGGNMVKYLNVEIKLLKS